MKLKYLRYVFSAVLLILAVSFIYSKFKNTYYDISLVFKEANVALFLVLILLQALSYVGDGWLSKTLLKIAGFKIGLRETLLVAILGVLGGQVAPILGGAMLTFYFYKKLKLPSGTILFLVTSWTLCNFIIGFLFFVLSLFFLPESNLSLISRQVVTGILLSSFILTILSYFLLKNRGKYFIVILNFFVGLINKIGKSGKRRHLIGPEKPKILISDFYQSYNFLATNKRNLPEIIAASILFYLTNVATLYFSFLVFGYEPNFAVVIFGLTVSVLLTAFTLMPELPGVMEASLTVVFLNLGFPAHIALFSIILYRFLSYWLPLPFGIFSYFRIKKYDK